MQNSLIQLLERSNFSCFKITLGPGVVRYLCVEEFLGANVEETISLIRSLPDSLEIEEPPPIRPGSLTQEFKRNWPEFLHQENWMKLDFESVNRFADTKTWDNKLRIQHALGRLFLAEGMPSWVYCRFHELLRLKEIAFDECLKSWIKGAIGDRDITNSYRKSSDHIIVYERDEDIECVFTKTPFVMEKLNVLERDEEEKKATIELEMLRLSRFDCFIYLIEDFRNKTFKIGRSKTPARRERTLQSEVPQVAMRFSIPADESHERQLHEYFQNKRLRGEWFALTNDDLIWAVAFLKSHGDISRAIVDYQWLGNIYFASTTTTSNK